jgi:hypothetical protein
MKVAYFFNSVLSLLLTIVAMGAVLLVVGDAAVELWRDERAVLAILAVVGFPMTFVVWPWTHEAFGIPLWIVFIAGTIAFSMVKYWVQTGEPAARAPRAGL